MKSNLSSVQHRLDRISARCDSVKQSITFKHQKPSKYCKAIRSLKKADYYLRVVESIFEHRPSSDSLASNQEASSSHAASTSRPTKDSRITCGNVYSSKARDSDTDSDADLDSGVAGDCDSDSDSDSDLDSDSDSDSVSESDFITVAPFYANSDTEVTENLDPSTAAAGSPDPDASAADDYASETGLINPGYDSSEALGVNYSTFAAGHSHQPSDHNNNSDVGHSIGLETDVGSTPDPVGESSTPDYEVDTPVESEVNPYASDEPDVTTIPDEAELALGSWETLDCQTATLRGVHCGRFGRINQHSIIAYGPQHLSAWTTNLSSSKTDLTDLLPKGTIKKLVPLSSDVLSIIADLKDKPNGQGDDEILLFDISNALRDKNPTTSLTRTWSKLSSHKRKNSIISGMHILSNSTHFLSSELRSSEVTMHSFKQKNGVYTDASSTILDAKLSSPASALCYEVQNKRVIASTAFGQVSVVDAMTQTLIYGGWISDSSDRSKGLKISNLAICPSSPHLAMASSSTRANQINIIDIRTPLQSVLTLGKPLLSEYPKEIVPAWDPYSGVIVAPFNRSETGNTEDVINIFDTRFDGCLETEPKRYNSLGTGTWSISFGIDEGFGFPMMVTAGDNGTIGVASYLTTV